MVDSIQGLLTETGNFLLQSRAFGDPEEAFKQNTPPGLLDQFDEQQRQRLGERLQSKFRLPGSRQLVRKRFRNDVENLAEQEQAAAQLEQFQNNVLSMNIPDAQKRRLLTVGPELGRELLSQSGSTLGPGDKRLGPLNQPANNNPTSDIQEFQQAQLNGFQGSFQQFQDRNVRTEVSPGEAVLDADGNLVFRNPNVDQQNRDAGVGTGSENEVQTTFNGVDAETGENLGTFVRTNRGIFRQRGVDENGDPVLIPVEDASNIREISTSVQGSRQDTLGSPDLDLSGNASIPEDVDVEDTTGLPGTVRRGINLITDQIGLGAAAEKTDRAQRVLTSFSNLAQLRLADLVTEGKRSNFVIEKLQSLTPDATSLLQGSDAARNQLETLRGEISRIVDDESLVVENPNSFTESQVSKARLNTRSLNGLVKDIDIMLDGFGRDGQRQSSQDIGEPPRDSGLTAREWRLLTPEEREEARQVFGDSQ